MLHIGWFRLTCYSISLLHVSSLNYSLIPPTLGKEEREKNPLVFPQTLLQLSNKPVRFYPVSLQKGHCLTLTERRDSKQLNQTKADMTITEANMLTDSSIVCLAWTVSRKCGITMHCTGFLFGLLFEPVGDIFIHTTTLDKINEGCSGTILWEI